MPLQKAIESLHYPAPNANVAALQNKTDPAWQRLKFDELLAQQITLKLAQEKRRTKGTETRISERVGNVRLLEILSLTAL